MDWPVLSKGVPSVDNSTQSSTMSGKYPGLFFWYRKNNVDFFGGYMNEIFKIRGYRGGSTGKLQLWIYVRTVSVPTKKSTVRSTLK